MFPSWEKKKQVVAVSRVMILRGDLCTNLVEVKPALPAAVARTPHLFRTGSAVVSGVSWTGGVFVECQWMLMTLVMELRHVPFSLRLFSHTAQTQCLAL
ncbi:hypothetical protein V6N13_087730 [Hibiscus sabdariffa]